MRPETVQEIAESRDRLLVAMRDLARDGRGHRWERANRALQTERRCDTCGSRFPGYWCSHD